jgi:hypothetical protein
MTTFSCSMHSVIRTEMKLRKFEDFTRLVLIATSKDGSKVEFTMFSNMDDFPMPSFEIQCDEMK